MLGLLLLRPNQVVATSELLGALWPDESRPMTARKIVQNAVSGLRTTLSVHHTRAEPQGAPPPELITRAPGYVLRVDPAALDMTRFDDKATAGRAKLAAGEPAAAAELLREALAEWRGPALSDLMEQGVDWPEVAGLRQLRLDAMEYRFEAELACGRHHTVLGELNSLAEAEPLRERLSGQLMLALYRCGRQAEALDVFSRVRRALVEEHGLEPSRDLQALQRRILHHDRELTSPVEEVPASVRLVPGPASAGRTAPAAPPAPPLLTVAGQGPERGAAEAPGTPRPPQPVPARPDGGAVLSRRRDVCVLLVRVRARTGGGGAAVPEALDGSLNEAAASLADIVEAHQGTIVGSLGYLTAALFGLRDDWAAAPLEAVRAAFAMRDAVGALPGLGIEAVVTMGRALVREDAAGAVSVVGTLLDTAQHLLADVPPGKVHVGQEVAAGTEGWVRYRKVARGPDGSAKVREACALHTREVPVLGGETHVREHELAILSSHLDHSRHHHAPYLVTVLGDQDMSRSRFLTEFQHRVGRLPDEARVLRPAAPEQGGFGLLGLTDALLDAWAVASGACRGAPVDELLTELVRGAAGTGPTGDRLLRALLVSAPPFQAARPRAVMDVWKELLVLCARQLPLVLCLDGLHLADEAVLDWVEELVATVEDAPLLVVAGAHPQLLGRRPLWGVGGGRTSMLSLVPLPEAPTAPLRVAAGQRRPAVHQRVADVPRHSRGQGCGAGPGGEPRVERRMAR
ncbi:BTAD domain-containing putative transcriptional regulator [Streptomyces sp. NPDC088755]|uniref:BTAD domain-containing putative transcriptional regulator n=1 Tax=Streptomyces sp. NPDC088755 TaxID=3365888 RepID=UPI0037F5CF84